MSSVPVCKECGKLMLPTFDAFTNEKSYICMQCSNPCIGCPKREDCDDTYGPDCGYERKWASNPEKQLS